eukprot:1397496-Alexandrium_andersonii.AAC.1
MAGRTASTTTATGARARSTRSRCGATRVASTGPRSSAAAAEIRGGRRSVRLLRRPTAGWMSTPATRRRRSATRCWARRSR